MYPFESGLKLESEISRVFEDGRVLSFDRLHFISTLLLECVVPFKFCTSVTVIVTSYVSPSEEPVL